MKYEVLYAESLSQLELAIEYHIRLGWTKLGGMTICSKEQYYQTIVK